jgi:hypothetical protein
MVTICRIKDCFRMVALRDLAVQDQAQLLERNIDGRAVVPAAPDRTAGLLGLLVPRQ